MSAKSGTLNLRIGPAKHDWRTRAAEKCGKCLSGCMTEGIRSISAMSVWVNAPSAFLRRVFDAVDAEPPKPGITREALVKLFDSKVDRIV